LGDLVSAANRVGRRVLVPVARRNIVVRADVGATEAEVVVAQRTVAVIEIAVVGDDAVVVSSIVAGSGAARQVLGKAAEGCIVLLEYNGLGLDFADLLSDDLLGHLLQNHKALLDDGHRLRVADELRVLLHNGLFDVVVGEVVRAVEVVKVGKGRNSTPVVEGLAPGSKIVPVGNRAGHHASGECDGDERSGKFGEHDDYVLRRMCSDCVKKVRPTGRIQTKGRKIVKLGGLAKQG